MKIKKYVAPMAYAVEMATEEVFLGGSQGADTGASLEIDYNEQVIEGGAKENNTLNYDIWEKDLIGF